MLELIRAALDGTGYPFAHFGWSTAPEGDYGVYAEDGENVLYASDQHAETALTGTVDLFTRDHSDGPRQAVETALAAVPACAWYLSSVQYESDTGYIHLEWAFEVA